MKADNKNTKIGILKTIGLIGLIVWVSFFIIDFSLMKHENEPIFCMETGVDDGGSVIYTGLGYVIEKVVDHDEYFNNGNQVFIWNIRPWFM